MSRLGNPGSAKEPERQRGTIRLDDFHFSRILGLALLAAPRRRTSAPRQNASQIGDARAGLEGVSGARRTQPGRHRGAPLDCAPSRARWGIPSGRSTSINRFVAAQPQNVDALLGLGDALTTRPVPERRDVLSRAEALAADRPAILAAQGRLHRAAGRTTLALAYFERALALEPGNTEVSRAGDALRAERAHRLEGTYDFERFSTDDPDTHAGTIEVNARAGDVVAPVRRLSAPLRCRTTRIVGAAASSGARADGRCGPVRFSDRSR